MLPTVHQPPHTSWRQVRISCWKSELLATAVYLHVLCTIPLYVAFLVGMFVRSFVRVFCVFASSWPSSSAPPSLVLVPMSFDWMSCLLCRLLYSGKHSRDHERPPGVSYETGEIAARQPLPGRWGALELPRGRRCRRGDDGIPHGERMMLLMILLMVMMLLMILIQAGSSIKPQIPSESNIHAVFERFDPEIVLTCLTCPCRAFYDGFFLFFFFRQVLWFLYFLGYLGLKGSQISSEKKQKTKKQKKHS